MNLTDAQKDTAQLLLWAAEIRRRGHDTWADLIAEAVTDGDLDHAAALLRHAQSL